MPDTSQPAFQEPEFLEPTIEERKLLAPEPDRPDPEEHAACRAMSRIMMKTENGWECRERAQSEEECLARQEEGVAEAYYLDEVYRACFHDVIDGGTPCTGTEDCDGYCEAPTGAAMGDEVYGTCSHRTLEECIQMVNDGMTAPWACV